jgi:hypothetical protein
MRLYQKYLITIGVAVVIGFLVALAEKIFFLRDTTEIIEALIDIFFVPGALIFGFGILVVATNGGTFDMLVYGIARFASLFKKEHNNVKFKTFLDSAYNEGFLKNMGQGKAVPGHLPSFFCHS